MTAYYNEIDPYAAQWLRNLIDRGHIARGDVDERSIVDVRADDLRGYTQCHFFAGIGGWSVALRLAGWDDDRSVWTGSCPCQPFSAAGAGKAADDGRHLWPAWFSLVAECHPPIVYGEQVEAAIGWGWLDAVCADLEGEGYACGASVLPACGVGAPHIRNRLWFMANANGGDASAKGLQRSGEYGQRAQDGCSSELGHTEGHHGRSQQPARSEIGGRRGPSRNGRLGDTECPSLERQRPLGISLESKQETRRPGYADAWSDIEFIQCADGKARPTQSGLFPLAHGVSGRMGRLRAYGNAIVPQVAAQFIGASMRASAFTPADREP